MIRLSSMYRLLLSCVLVSVAACNGGSTPPSGAGGAPASGSGGSGTGAGGQATGSGGGAVDGAVPDGNPADAYVVDRGTNPPDILVHVANKCPFDLWIHAAGSTGTLTPDKHQLGTGQAQDYYAPKTWASARVTAFLGGPDAQGNLQNEIDKVEATFGPDNNGVELLNYNITYVDWVGLPSEVEGIGTGADCKRVGCYQPVANVAASCPSGLLAGKRCLSAGMFCSIGANQASSFCHALDQKVAECAQKYADCAGAAGSTTGQVYGCAGGFFSASPRYCAALNRGVLDDPGDTVPMTSFYQTPPYNTYSKWVHGFCPGIYAFPYDDFGKDNESGFHACGGGTQLNITFCPAG